MARTHQFARIAAFPRGDGELQQVNVQNTHIVCVTQRHREVCQRATCCLLLVYLTSTDDLIDFNVKGWRLKIIVCRTSPQVHGVGLTFVREVESGVIQDESDHRDRKTDI